jgi:hypothetical protein
VPNDGHPLSIIASDEFQRERQAQLAERYLVNAGLYLPSEAGLDDLFGRSR